MEDKQLHKKIQAHGSMYLKLINSHGSWGRISQAIAHVALASGSSALQQTPSMRNTHGSHNILGVSVALTQPAGLGPGTTCTAWPKGMLSTGDLFITVTATDRGSNTEKKNDHFTKQRYPPKNSFTLETLMFLVFLSKNYLGIFYFQYVFLSLGPLFHTN